MTRFILLFIFVIFSVTLKAQDSRSLAVNRPNFKAEAIAGGPNNGSLSDSTAEVSSGTAYRQLTGGPFNSSFFASSNKTILVQPSVARSTTESITTSQFEKIIHLPTLTFNVLVVDSTLLQQANNTSSFLTISFQ